MINSMVTATLSQYGLDQISPMAARREALSLFTRMMLKAKRRALWHFMLRKENKLQDLAHVAATANHRPARQTSIVIVPLHKIVGSEGRTNNDFDDKFNPLRLQSRDRWASIICARRRGFPLPPVALIQVGDKFYVRDGHHRISVANAVGQAEIEAQILFTLEDRE